MEVFQNKINANKFKSTNYTWNQLKLNHPWSVGYVSTLIESKTFQSKGEWKAFHYESGEERLRLINKCSEEEKALLMNFAVSPRSLPAHLKSLNLNYGRTELELEERGRYMYQKIVEKGNPNHVTCAECIYMVKFRVMGETWNGIIAREHNTVRTLQQLFPEWTFVKSEGERDYRYAIDYEIYQNDQLTCAIQIKPMSYKQGFSAEIIKAKKANEAKNRDYQNDYQASVLYVYSNSKGIILNPEVIAELKGQALLKTAFFQTADIDYSLYV